ncbi:MAG: SAVED domain-containing protein [Acidimicrobiia bacterium]|nr:SAVED domain-containing protein [Acidimicrobiia bacterium]
MISETTTRLLLVRSGGRCTMCYRDLLHSETTWRDVYLGERAHIIGRTPSKGSPRGDHDLDVRLRDDPENLLLLCAACHDDLDHRDNLDVHTVQRLRGIKAAHENRIRQILSIPPGNETTILRLHGTIGESNVIMDRSVAAAAVLEQGRVARFDLSHEGIGVEVDLRRVPNPDPADPAYYQSSRTAIDRIIGRQLAPAVEDGTLRHLSVFAIARWPLLVYLGARIGDKLDSDIYQRHRATESWAWPRQGPDTQFDWQLVHDGNTNDGDAVLVLALSAAVHHEEVPASLSGVPSYRIAPAEGATPHYDVIGTRESLKSAERAFREVLADIEHHRKATRRLHVVGAAPLSACVALGRAVTTGVHPTLMLYDRGSNSYQLAMEI